MPARLTMSLTVSVVTISLASGWAVMAATASGEPSRICRGKYSARRVANAGSSGRSPDSMAADNPAFTYASSTHSSGPERPSPAAMRAAIWVCVGRNSIVRSNLPASTISSINPECTESITPACSLESTRLGQVTGLHPLLQGELDVDLVIGGVDTRRVVDRIGVDPAAVAGELD